RTWSGISREGTWQMAPLSDPSVRGQRAILRDRSPKEAGLRHICRPRRRSEKTLETHSTTTQSSKKLGLIIRCPRRGSEKTSEARPSTTTTQSPKRNSNDESTRSAYERGRHDRALSEGRAR